MSYLEFKKSYLPYLGCLFLRVLSKIIVIIGFFFNIEIIISFFQNKEESSPLLRLIFFF